MAVRSSRFTTVGLAEADARDAWHQATASTYETRQDGGPFRASVESWNLDSLLLTSSVVSPMRFIRTRKLVSRSGVDHYAFLYCRTGSVITRIDGTDTLIGTGDIAVRDMGQEVETCCDDDDEKVLVFVPRDILGPLLPPGVRRNLHGAHLRAGTPMCDLLASHLRGLCRRLGETDPAEIPFIASATLNLLAGGVVARTSDAGETERCFPVETQAKIKSYIIEHLAHPEMGPDFVMRHFRMSRTTLYDLFKPLSGVANFIQEQRLRRCLRDLSDPRHQHRRISDIAYSWGFNSDTHFSRSFRQAFGVSPGEARRASLISWDSRSEGRDPPSPAFLAACRLDDWVRRLGGCGT